MQEIKLKQQLVISQPAILKVLCFFIMLLLTVGRNEIQVKAEGLTINSYLMINKQVMVEDGEVKLTKVTDKNGGTATYDVACNTLTLKNFTISNEGSMNTKSLEAWFHAFQMPENFQIVLIGENTIYSNFRYNVEKGVENSIFQLDTPTAVITGPGSLKSNVCIGGGGCFWYKNQRL